MCDACFRFVVSGDPACVRCAHELRTRARRQKSFAISVALVALGAGALLWRRGEDWHVWALGGVGALAGVMLSGVLFTRLSRRAPPPEVARRTDELPRGDVAVSAAAIRAARRRRLAALLTPSLSGRSTALFVLAAMAFAAIAFPVALRLPRWLELEVVLGAWWSIGFALLSTVLYRGYRLEDDHFFHAPGMDGQTRDAFKGFDPSGGCDPGGFAGGCDDIAGGFIALAALVVFLFAILVVAWLVVELAIPLAFVAFYVLAVAAIRRAARDNHACRDRLGRSLLWGATWSTLYFAPLAAIVVAVQYALAHAR